MKWATFAFKADQTQTHVVFLDGFKDTPISRTRSVIHPSPSTTSSKVVFVITVDQDMLFRPMPFDYFPRTFQEVVLLFKRRHPGAPWDPAHAYGFAEQMGFAIMSAASNWPDNERQMVRSITIVNSEAVPTPQGPESPVKHAVSMRVVVEELVDAFDIEGVTFSFLSLDEYERKVGTRQFFIEADPTYHL
jgi:hypothetical protein